MKKVLIFQLVAGGAVTNSAATLISEDGQTKSSNLWTANKKWGITKVIIMGASTTYVTLTRSGHSADTMVLMPPADTLADLKKTINLAKILGGKAVIIDAKEGLSVTATTSGATTTNITLELDDSMATTNARAVRAAGTTAMVANTPTESGANVVTGLNPNGTYRVRGTYLTSTSMQSMVMRLGNNYIALPSTNAIQSGQGYTTLTTDQATLMTGEGSEYTSTFSLWGVASAADAANTQFFGVIFEAS